MKKKSLDGLPGLTMQGTKGPAGKRGYTTFYNYNEKFNLTTQDENQNLVYGELCLGFASSTNDDILDTEICIPSYSITPIINDRVLNTEEKGLGLYEIKDIISIPFSYKNEGTWKLNTPENISNVLKEQNFNNDSYELIFNKINEMLSFYENYMDMIEDYLENLAEFNIYILKKLDTVEFSKQKTSSEMQDISVKIISNTIKYKRWENSYYESDSSLFKDESENFKKVCLGHSYDIVYNDLNKLTDELNQISSNDMSESPNEFRASIENLHIRLLGSTGENFDKILYGIPITVSAYVIPNIGNIPSGSPLYDVWSSWEVNETKDNITKISQMSTLSGDIEEFPTWNEDHTEHAVLLKAEISEPGHGTFIPAFYLINEWNGGYSCMRNNERIDMYLFETTGDNNTITHYDYYPYIDSSKPVTTEIKVDNENGGEYVDDTTDELAIIKFSVTMPIENKDKAKLAVYAEFEKNDSGIYVYKMSTVRDKLWPAVTEVMVEDENNETPKLNWEAIEEGASIASEYPYGVIDNYKDINFDDEDLGNFEIIIKDFNEGNDKQIFYSSKIFPASMVEQYKVLIYMYYKSSNASYQKLYLGEAQLKSSLE